MSTPQIIQMAAQFASDTSTLAFTNNVTKGSFLLTVTLNEQSSVSDNLNGAWTILASGDQGGATYTIAYLPVSVAGSITVTYHSPDLPLIAEISACTLTASSAVAAGTIPSNNATTITSATVSGLAGQLILGYANINGSAIASASSPFTLQNVTGPPTRTALETYAPTASGSYGASFVSTTNNFNGQWFAGVLALTGASSGGSWTQAYRNFINKRGMASHKRS